MCNKQDDIAEIYSATLTSSKKMTSLIHPRKVRPSLCQEYFIPNKIHLSPSCILLIDEKMIHSNYGCIGRIATTVIWLRCDNNPIIMHFDMKDDFAYLHLIMIK